MKKMEYLTLDERKIIEQMLKEGYSGRAIARTLNRSASTVNSDIRLNGSKEEYNAEKAHADSKRKIFKEDLTLNSLKKRLENLEMQLEILLETIKDIKNGS